VYNIVSGIVQQYSWPSQGSTLSHVLYEGLHYHPLEIDSESEITD